MSFHASGRGDSGAVFYLSSRFRLQGLFTQDVSNPPNMRLSNLATLVSSTITQNRLNLSSLKMADIKLSNVK